MAVSGAVSTAFGCSLWSVSGAFSGVFQVSFQAFWLWFKSSCGLVFLVDFWPVVLVRFGGVFGVFWVQFSGSFIGV